FHRNAFSDLVPWALPLAEDLAHGADLKLVGDRTVAIVPHGEARWRAEAETQKEDTVLSVTWLRVHLVFAADGRLAERQLVRMPKGEIRSRTTYTSDGVVTLYDADGKLLWTRKSTLRPAQEPGLTANTKNLVVLSLPYRSRAHILRTRKIENKPYEQLRFDD